VKARLKLGVRELDESRLAHNRKPEVTKCEETFR
jgi:hypothetical protein